MSACRPFEGKVFRLYKKIWNLIVLPFSFYFFIIWFFLHPKWFRSKCQRVKFTVRCSQWERRPLEQNLCSLKIWPGSGFLIIFITFIHSIFYDIFHGTIQKKSKWKRFMQKKNLKNLTQLSFKRKREPLEPKTYRDRGQGSCLEFSNNFNFL